MNYRYVAAQLGLLMLVLSAAIAVVGIWSAFAWFEGEVAESPACRALWLSALVGGVLGGLCVLIGRTRRTRMGSREAMLLVGTAWIVGAALAAVPYRLWAGIVPESIPHDPGFDSYVNCYFESMSGLTTTGATILNDIPTIPRSILLWRATTHWLGGLGIVVLFVAVLPSLGVGGKKVFRIESPGPTPEGVRPKIHDTARTLWIIYLGLTIAEVLALKILGMSMYNAICHTFATLATGGFSTWNSSMAGAQSSAIDVVIIIFMLLAGVNFGIYYHLIRKRWRSVIGDPELKLYLAILLVGSAIVSLSILNLPIYTTSGEEVPGTWWNAVRYGVFQTVSIQTTTGFCTADFNRWPDAARITLVLLMFCGASAGSTGGGIKVVRILIAVKVLWAEFERVFRPNVVRPIKVGNSAVDPELRQATLAYILIIILLFGVGSIGILLFEDGNPTHHICITTAATASAATLNNIGPGLELVGATETYAKFSDPSKILMTFLMALGRLEVFAIAVLFFPRFWIRD